MTTPSLTPLLDLTDDLMQQVNAIIVDRMQSEIDLIPSLAGHLVSSGGKRMRPVLTLAGALATGAADDRAVKLAAAVEFIHTATLLHDDVIDDSAMRRGQQTANIIWGNEASVLVGDFLFARAFELMVETGDITVLGRIASAS
ncbi:MAG: polyprenyl synthetase family protein, partial [Candidatus Puniceispirillales bacterium]